uniref:hypothetical protein n=1 Tax=Bacillus subtilis TaxID=1423 RepID=UPI001BDBA2A3
IAIMGLANIRAAAAVSPRSDGLVKVRLEHTNGETVEDQISLEQVSSLAAEQQPSVDSERQPTEPPAPEGATAARLGGIIYT